MPRLFIADPSLKDIRGHHYMMTRAATLSAQECGFSVTWLCSSEFADELGGGDVAIERAFGASMYQNYIEQKKYSLERNRSFFSRLTHRIKRTKPPQGICLASRYYEELTAVLEKCGADEHDRLLLHTADGASFIAVTKLLAEKEPAQLPLFHVATPYDPVGVMPNRSNADEIAERLQDLHTRGMIDKKIFLYGENKHLAAHLSSLWGLPVRSLDAPVYPSDEKKTSDAAKFRRDALKIADDVFVVASLGSARLEKGFHLLPEIVRRTHALKAQRAADGMTAPAIKFVLHASPQIAGRDPAVLKAIDEMKMIPSSQVELLLEPLSETDYQNMLHASDAILMPYDAALYRVRSSGVVSEAIAAGKVIIATEGSYPGEAAKEYYGETALTPEDFAQRVIRISENLEDYKERARTLSSEFVRKNGISAYWRKCLDAETRQV